MEALGTVDRWFRLEDAGDGTTLLWEPHIDEFFVSNVWHVRGRDRDLLVDTANGIGDLRGEVAPLLEGREVIAVVTHEHFDHTGGLFAFDERLCHSAAAAGVRAPYPVALLAEHSPPDLAEVIRAYGYEPPDVVVTALPPGGVDLQTWRTPGAEPTSVLEEGDLIDLGDRMFEVLHVPGHTEGSIALWERSTGTLFSGDTACLDDPLFAADEAAFARSLRRLRKLPVEVVRPGHSRSFGRTELHELIDRELAARDA